MVQIFRKNDIYPAAFYNFSWQMESQDNEKSRNITAPNSQVYIDVLCQIDNIKHLYILVY